MEQVRRVHDESGAIVADRYLVYPYNWSLKVYPRDDPGFTLDTRELADYLYHRALISPGDAHWTWIQTPSENTGYCDCAFDGDGRTLYAMRHDGAIHAFDLHGRPALERKAAGFRCGGHMDEDPTTTTTAADGDRPWRTEWIKVYRVDLAAQTLVEIKNLGNHALFVGCNHSFSLAASDCPGILPNHVYYTDNEEYYALYSPQCPRDIGIYNVGDGSFHEIQPPCPWLNWPLPSWITSSLAQTE
ncbi:hypothetical protein BAE44_0014688 [Dichanthelium oligosanthes]|uniref:KIB1-4 beta-propeller domain-containing protein n=1 Tax=Dichanthelium oligosanthes TaxID=888268 RepID=A0A1E5VGW8_9POAL|nr:hypothetical protein BAE44_0014688 [Dichanthelium oligosanthes]